MMTGRKYWTFPFASMVWCFLYFFPFLFSVMLFLDKTPVSPCCTEWKSKEVFLHARFSTWPECAWFRGALTALGQRVRCQVETKGQGSRRAPWKLIIANQHISKHLFRQHPGMIYVRTRVKRYERKQNKVTMKSEYLIHRSDVYRRFSKYTLCFYTHPPPSNSICPTLGPVKWVMTVAAYTPRDLENFQEMSARRQTIDIFLLSHSYQL